MGKTPVLLDHMGKPVRRTELRREVAAPTIGGVRSPISGYPGDGLDPERLAAILRAADRGDPIQYLELAETIEERDPHYQGVIGTRRRAVSQIEITVEAGSDDPVHERHAQELRDWLKRDELTDELFDILDCIPKGYSFTEIIWDTSEGQWQPRGLERRDPRWFRFEQHNLTIPVMLDDHGQEVPLPAFKFIYAQIKAKSGLALRSGLSRVAMWGWLFKAYTQRDWAIFSQTYGQPLRVGKWAAGASEEDKNTLFNAVANIAGDCAAIIPDSMMIEFIETSNVGSSSDLYEKRSNWLDMQISKAVLGQTATTDSVTGGLGSGKEHGEVREDIERSDARALTAILNRDLVRPFVQLNHGMQTHYPRLKIERPEAEDQEALARTLAIYVPLGLRVKEDEVRGKLGLAEPKDDDRILGQSAEIPPQGADASDPSGRNSPVKRFSGPVKRSNGFSGAEAALQASTALSGPLSAPTPEGDLTERLVRETQDGMREMLEAIEAMIEVAGSADELRAMLLGAYPDIEVTKLAELMADAMLAAHAGGRALTEDERG